MFDRTKLIDLIENAERANPTCPQCGSMLVVATRDGSIWLECPTLAESRPLIRQIISLDFEAAHRRSLLLSAAEVLAA